MEYRGYRYGWSEDRDTDVSKINHYAVTPDGRLHHLDFTPYEFMMSEDFRIMVDLGLPDRFTLGLWSPIHRSDLVRARDLLERLSARIEDLPLLMKLDRV